MLPSLLRMLKIRMEFQGIIFEVEGNSGGEFEGWNKHNNQWNRIGCKVKCDTWLTISV